MIGDSTFGIDGWKYFFGRPLGLLGFIGIFLGSNPATWLITPGMIMSSGVALTLTSQRW